MKFSANLGFLWKALRLPDAIQAAKAAGFDAVECHAPYDTTANECAAALKDTGLPMVGINTSFGNTTQNEFGLAALSGSEAKAKKDIDTAVAYAATIGASNVHVLSGNTSGVAALETYKANLYYAATIAAAHQITILIEPLNPFNNPGYFMNSTQLAAKVINDLALPNLKLMFDCYHVQLLEGNLSNRFKQLLPMIGHVQIASVPTRNEPTLGEVAYERLLPAMYDLGYTGYIGAEYKPASTVEAGLSWLEAYRG